MKAKDFIETMVFNGSIKQIRVYEKGTIEENVYFPKYIFNREDFSKIDFIKNYGERKVYAWEIFNFIGDGFRRTELSIYLGKENEK